jgi:hypothetical protein
MIIYLNSKFMGLLIAAIASLWSLSCTLVSGIGSVLHNENKIYTGVWHSLHPTIKDGIHIDSTINCDLKFDGTWYVKAHAPRQCTIFYRHNNILRRTGKLVLSAVNCPYPELEIRCILNSSAPEPQTPQWILMTRPSDVSISGLLSFSPNSIQYTVIWDYTEILDPNGKVVFSDLGGSPIPGARFDAEVNNYAKPGNKLIFSGIDILMPDGRRKTFPDDTLHFREGYGFCK